ncbi:MAG: family efflux transporter [Firmicutes bacterium]|nr:family efflux transporter [Bacillota bacterium]
MEQKQNIEVFERMPVPKAVAKIVLPAIASMLMVFIYNIADTFFIGQTGDELQVAAVALTTPVFLLFMATGTLFGVGGTSVISRAIGEGRLEYAKKASAFCFYAAIAIGCILMVSFWIFMPAILSFIGTSKDTIGFAHEFLKYVALSAPFVLVSQSFSNIVRAEGRAKEAMNGMLLGTIVNIILNPIFILGFNLGVVGSAIATVIGNIIAAGYYVLYLLQGKSILSIALKDFQVNDKIMTGVFAIGIPAFITDILMSVANVILNNFLAVYGDVQVAAMGVAMKAGMMVVLLQIGLGQGIQPLLGFNYGAGNYRRLRDVIQFSSLCSIIFGTIITVAVWLNIDFFIRVFIDNEDVVKYGVIILKAMLLSGPVVGLLFIFTSALQAMGKALPSLILSLSRQGLVFIPLLFILNALGGFNGIVYVQPLVDFVSILLSAVLYFAVSRSMGSKKEQPQQTPAGSIGAMTADAGQEAK